MRFGRVSKGQFLINLKLCSAAPIDGGQPPIEGNPGGAGEGGQPPEGNPTPPAGNPKEGQETKTYSIDEVNKVVSTKLKEEKAKWQAGIEAEKAEAAKLAKMTETEKQQHLLDKQKAEIEEKEKTIAAREMKLTKIDIFNEKKLPIELVDCVQGDDADTVKANIDTFEKAWQSAIDKAVEERLKGHSPFNTSGSNGKGTGLAKQILQSKQSSNIKTLEDAKKSYFK
jgi:hypothetical protein